MSSSSDETDESLAKWRATLRARLEEQGIHYPRQDSFNPPGRLLIDRIQNQWEQDEKAAAAQYTTDDEDYYPHDSLTYKDREPTCFDENGCCDLDSDESCPNVTLDLVSTRRFRRWFILTLIVLVAIMWYWATRMAPFLRAEWVFKEAFVNQEQGTFGLGRGGEWQNGGQRIQYFPENLLPGGEGDAEGKRRLIFVGDIHGCLSELLALEEKVGFRAGYDHLIAVGDVISKGPDSPGVLDELIRINATSVRGNHEDRILETARLFSSESPLDPPTPETSSKKFAKDMLLLKSLKKHHLSFLRQMPLILRISPLPQAKSVKKNAIRHELLVVHGGLVPHLELHKQDPYYVMNMRSINFKTHSPSETRFGRTKANRPWTELWNWYNRRLAKGRSMRGFRELEPDDTETTQVSPAASGPGQTLQAIIVGRHRRKPQVVLYGHDSRTGLNIRDWSKGIDTGCVRGGKLTAFVLHANGDNELVSVDCKDYGAMEE